MSAWRNYEDAYIGFWGDRPGVREYEGDPNAIHRPRSLAEIEASMTPEQREERQRHAALIAEQEAAIRAMHPREPGQEIAEALKWGRSITADRLLGLARSLDRHCYHEGAATARANARAILGGGTV